MTLEEAQNKGRNIIWGIGLAGVAVLGMMLSRNQRVRGFARARFAAARGGLGNLRGRIRNYRRR